MCRCAVLAQNHPHTTCSGRTHAGLSKGGLGKQNSQIQRMAELGGTGSSPTELPGVPFWAAPGQLWRKSEGHCPTRMKHITSLTLQLNQRDGPKQREPRCGDWKISHVVQAFLQQRKVLPSDCTSCLSSQATEQSSAGSQVPSLGWNHSSAAWCLPGSWSKADINSVVEKHSP